MKLVISDEALLKDVDRVMYELGLDNKEVELSSHRRVSIGLGEDSLDSPLGMFDDNV